MARSISITYARLTNTPTVSFDPATGQGEIIATYVVGEVVPAVAHEDGSIVGPIHREHPTANNAPGVAVPIGPTDTAAAKMGEMLQAIAACEGLDLTAGDSILGVDGTQIAP